MPNSPENSSQGTIEDPTGPGSDAGRATLTMTPDNAESKLAFSSVADWVLKQPTITGTSAGDAVDRARSHANKFMWIESVQRRDADVSRYLRRMSQGNLSSSSPTSSPSREPATAATTKRDTDPVPSAAAAWDLPIWHGCYFIDLDRAPLNPGRGWTAGRLRTDLPNDFVLALDRSVSHGVRDRHVLFQIHRDTARVYMHQISRKSEIDIDGTVLSAGKMHLLNRHSARVRIGQLAFRLEYARFSQDPLYADYVHRYLEILHAMKLPPSLLALTPTPSSTGVRQVGSWALTNAGTIGTGGEGRVSVGVDDAGHVVALKRVSVSRHAAGVFQRRQRTMQELTRLARSAQEDRILRLIEVISDDPTIATIYDTYGGGGGGGGGHGVTPVLKPRAGVPQRLSITRSRGRR